LNNGSIQSFCVLINIKTFFFCRNFGRLHRLFVVRLLANDNQMDQNDSENVIEKTKRRQDGI
jgi:hypothetical protein